MKNKGFTLIELSVVLVIVGLLLGATVVGLTTFIQRAKFTQAEEELQTAVDALMAYAIVNGTLPCPDDDGFPPGSAGTPDGIGDGTGTAQCAGGTFGEDVTVGYLPWAELGLPAADPWGTLYFYAVTEEFANDPAPNTVTFDLTAATTGAITVNDSNSAPINVIAQLVPALVFSVGANAHLTLAQASADEDQNLINAGANNGVFVSKTFVRAQAVGVGEAEFDDVLKWLPPNMLKLKMIEAGRLPE